MYIYMIKLIKLVKVAIFQAIIAFQKRGFYGE